MQMSAIWSGEKGGNAPDSAHQSVPDSALCWWTKNDILADVEVALVRKVTTSVSGGKKT